MKDNSGDNMTNKEKYTKEILEVVLSGHNIALHNGVIVPCYSVRCEECDWSFKDGKDCIKHMQQWANEEYSEEKNVMELKDTVNMMNSTDYNERFKAEYYQNIIRYNKLRSMLGEWDRGELSFKPTCPRAIYDKQVKAMKDYIAVLENRASIEKIEL